MEKKPKSKVVESAIWFNWFTCTVWGLCWYHFLTSQAGPSPEKENMSPKCPQHVGAQKGIRNFHKTTLRWGFKVRDLPSSDKRWNQANTCPAELPWQLKFLCGNEMFRGFIPKCCWKKSPWKVNNVFQICLYHIPQQKIELDHLISRAYHSLTWSTSTRQGGAQFAIKTCAMLRCEHQIEDSDDHV